MSHSNDADARSTISAGQRPYLLGLLLVALVLPSFVTWLYFAVLRDAPAAAQLGMAGGGNPVGRAKRTFWERARDACSGGL